jgi:hypothetical protein
MEVDMVTLTKQHPLDARPAVHQVTLSDAARGLGTLPRIDYEDAFRISGLPNLERSGEEWARAVLEDPPASVRAKLLCGWGALGLRLGAPWSQRRVLGWEVRRSDIDFVVLGAGGCLGLSGELLFKRESNGLLFATFVREQNPLARAVWSRVQDNHRQVVRSLLAHAARRVVA